MRKMLFVMMLLCGINYQDYAQTTTDINALFEVQSNPFRRRFTFDLGNMDKMQVEVVSLDDLSYLKNIDSIINVFIADLEPLQDSVARDVNSRTIGYSVDGAGLKRISIAKHETAISNYVIHNGDLTLLKIEQDTIIINGLVNGLSGKKIFQKAPEPHYFRISFFLNDLNELGMWRNKLNIKIETLTASVRGNWRLQDGKMLLQDHPGISAPASRGFTGNSNFISIRPGIDVQNFKNYFIPSISTACAIVTNKNLVHREYILGQEVHFVFSRNNLGQTKTYVNQFIILAFGQAAINPYTKKALTLYPFISLGYLVKRRGDLYEKGTFKLGLARLNLFGNYTKIEPTIYFSNFLHNITPSLRITQHF